MTTAINYIRNKNFTFWRRGNVAPLVAYLQIKTIIYINIIYTMLHLGYQNLITMENFPIIFCV